MVSRFVEVCLSLWVMVNSVFHFFHSANTKSRDHYVIITNTYLDSASESCLLFCWHPEVKIENVD